jgi:uncharacterized metal-binding protein
MLVAEVLDGKAVRQNIVTVEAPTDRHRLEQLSDLGIDVFICGAADPAFLTEAGGVDIRIIPDVAGNVDEILALAARGRLVPGHGTYADASAAEASGTLDCINCLDRVCLSGRSCPGTVPELHLPHSTTEHTRILDVASDIALETERRLCRVAEFVHFCHGMGYEHVGVAFCVELFRETRILTHLLRRFLRVSAVCCKVGGQPLDEDVSAARAQRVACNPIGQAAELNRLETHINAVVGLCMGCDLLFARHSIAPVTTVFVKDRSLANNPVGALYSHYYLTELADQTRVETADANVLSREGVKT